jgi:acetoacetate decarboxylase
MKEHEVRDRAFAMPLTQPAYPRGPYRFVDREYFIITYRTDPELPVLEVVAATHSVADLTLGLGKVVHDYLR